MANRQSVAAKAEALALPVAEKLNLSVWETEYVKEGASWFLRYYIDRPEGVGLDDCEAFSRAVDPLLDEADFIEDAYYLEVSSPGIERRLSKDEHFAFCMRQTVKARLIRPLDGVREFTGTLTAYENGSFTLSSEDGDHTLEQKACAWIRLADDTEW